MNNESESIRELHSLVEALVKAVVKHPDEVKLRNSVHGQLAVFGAEVAQDDVRRVIGAKGKHVKALQVIVKSLCDVINKEGEFAVVEERTTPPAPSAGPSRQFPLLAGRDFKPVKALLERTCKAIANSPNDVEVIETPMGQRHIFEIKANASAYHRLFGPTVTYEYGEDGLILGSIKNLFDAIGKNHGKLVMIVMTKK